VESDFVLGQTRIPDAHAVEKAPNPSVSPAIAERGKPDGVRRIGKPTARRAEFPSRYRMSEEAKASVRKATGIHNRLDRSCDQPERVLTSDG